MLNYSNVKLGKWDLTDLVDERSTKKFEKLVASIKKMSRNLNTTGKS